MTGNIVCCVIILKENINILNYNKPGYTHTKLTEIVHRWIDYIKLELSC